MWKLMTSEAALVLEISCLEDLTRKQKFRFKIRINRHSVNKVLLPSGSQFIKLDFLSAFQTVHVLLSPSPVRVCLCRVLGQLYPGSVDSGCGWLCVDGLRVISSLLGSSGPPGIQTALFQKQVRFTLWWC